MKKLMLINSISGEIVTEGDEIEYVKFKKAVSGIRSFSRVQMKTLKPFIRASKSLEADETISKLSIKSQARLFTIIRRLGIKNRIPKDRGHCRIWEDLIKINELSLTKRSFIDFRQELIKFDIIREYQGYLILNPIIAVNGSHFDKTLLNAFEDVVIKSALLTPYEVELIKRSEARC